MIDNFDLLLYHGHSLGEIVVLPDFPSQLLDFCFRDGLTFGVSNQHPDEGHAAADQGGENSLHALTSPQATSMWTKLPSIR